jgi:hypothetical protein
MNFKTQDLVKFFSQRDIIVLYAELKDAEDALNTSINRSGNVIHPGAFIVFRGILKKIIIETDWFQEMCEKADTECFAVTKQEDSDGEVKHG